MKKRLFVPLAALVAIVAIGWLVGRQSGPLYRHPITILRLINADAPRILPVPVTRVAPGGRIRASTSLRRADARS